MVGINSVHISGNVTGTITFQQTKQNQTPACSFTVVSDRKGPKGMMVSAKVKVNAYGDHLFNLCSSHLEKGTYVIVEGELMNRSGQHGDLTEVRAIEIIFPCQK